MPKHVCKDPDKLSYLQIRRHRYYTLNTLAMLVISFCTFKKYSHHEDIFKREPSFLEDANSYDVT